MMKHAATVGLILVSAVLPRAGRAQSYDRIAYEGYVLYEKGLATKEPALFRQAAQRLRAAAQQKATEREPLLWDAAMVAATGGDTAASLALLDEGIDAGMTDVAKVASRPVFDFLKHAPAWERLMGRLRDAERRYVSRLSRPALRTELLEMWAEDQRVRSLLRSEVARLNNNWGAPQLAPLYRGIEQRDSVNFRRIRAIIAEQGWPALSQVGKDGSFAAWAIVQHSNQVAFQEACVEAMEPLLRRGEVRPVEYAELVDRVRRNLQRRQRFGMAIRREGGLSSFYPIEDEAQVDERRKAIGLEPLAVYARLNGFEIPVKTDTPALPGKGTKRPPATRTNREVLRQLTK